ncbi:MAG TPA: hypothetical protein VF066_11095 [Thermoleophilaceae bacterium]
MTPRDRTATGRFRILVIANETAADDTLHELVVEHIGDMPAEVLVVAPAAPSRFARIESVEDAEARIAHVVGHLEADGIHAYGWVGHSDPLAAIAGALAVFEADELIVSTRGSRAHDLAPLARRRFGLPTTACVAERELLVA